MDVDKSPPDFYGMKTMADPSPLTFIIIMYIYPYACTGLIAAYLHVPSSPQVESLTRELQILGELYRQQKEDALAVLTHGNKQEEWTALCDTLRREKEGDRWL